MFLNFLYLFVGFGVGILGVCRGISHLGPYYPQFLNHLNYFHINFHFLVLSLTFTTVTRGHFLNLGFISISALKTKKTGMISSQIQM